MTDRIKSTFHKVTHTGSSGTTDSSRLGQFLKAGPNYWSVTAPYNLPAGLKVPTNADGSLQDTPLARYLVWKRDQAPEFFDKRHPKLAASMQLNDQFRNQAQLLAVTNYLTQQSQPHSLQLAPKTASMQVIVPPRQVAAQSMEQPTGQTVDPAPTVAPAPVPEPASVATSLALFGAAGAWYRRRRA